MKYTSTLKRTSMSLDTDTLDSIEALAAKWQTSKSEVIRRIVRITKLEEDSKIPPKSPVEALKWLQLNGLSKQEADKLNEEIRLEREAKRYWWE